MMNFIKGRLVIKREFSIVESAHFFSYLSIISLSCHLERRILYARRIAAVDTLLFFSASSLGLTLFIRQRKQNDPHIVFDQF